MPADALRETFVSGEGKWEGVTIVAIVPGCTGETPLRAIERREQHIALNGIVELVKMGELAVKLRSRTGRFTSKRGGFAAPSGDFLERVRKVYGPDIYPNARGVGVEIASYSGLQPDP